MSWWICSECNYIVEAEMPPTMCPECGKHCIFSDVTCYIPECGGPNNPDSRLIVKKMEDADKTR